MSEQLDAFLQTRPEGTATFSPCDRYRYTLGRTWDEGLGRVAWVMLNPSTADAFKLDPTVRRCVGFSKAWGYGGLWVLNVYALRSTDPKGLWTVKDPVGPGNDEAIRRILATVDRVVVAWGVHAKPERVERVAEIIAETGHVPECLGTTKAGAPRHPLYVKGDTPLQVWSPS